MGPGPEPEGSPGRRPLLSPSVSMPVWSLPLGVLGLALHARCALVLPTASFSFPSVPPSPVSLMPFPLSFLLTGPLCPKDPRGGGPPARLFWSRHGCHWPLVTPSWIGGPPLVQSADVGVRHGDSGDLLLRGPRRVEPRVLQTRHYRSRGGL